MSAYEDRVIEQLRGQETRYVNSIAKRAKERGEIEVFVQRLPRSIGDYLPWDLSATVAPNEIAGYRYPIDLILPLTQKWLDEFTFTIGVKGSELSAAQAEIERLREENNTLRGLLGNSAKPCPYCGLAAEDQSKCDRGFPGCARADDQMLSQHFADAYHAEQAERELATKRAEIERLREDAERLNWVDDNFRNGSIRWLPRAFEKFHIKHNEVIYSGASFRAAIDKARRA